MSLTVTLAAARVRRSEEGQESVVGEVKEDLSQQTGREGRVEREGPAKQRPWTERWKEKGCGGAEEMGDDRAMTTTMNKHRCCLM